MYAKYVYNSGATQANILADLTAILTGETTVANLSAGCNKTDTTITSTVEAGWTLHDGASGTNKKVLKAAYSGNASVFKYLELDYSYGINYGITCQFYETFDNSTHTGTNKTANSNTEYAQRMDTSSSGNILHIFSSARFVALFSQMANGSWGDVSNSGATLATEFKPLCPWTNDTDYPYPASCVSFSDSVSSSKKTYLSRAKTNGNSDVTGVSAVARLASIGATGYSNLLSSSDYFPTGANLKVYDDSGNLKVPRFPIFIADPPAFTMPIGDISACADIWFAPSSLLARLDTVTIGANPYIAIPATQTSVTYLIRKG
jgi:hypothetical protein